MRICHLSTYDNHGGAGRAAYRIHNALIEMGISSTLLVKNKRTNNPTIIASVEPRIYKLFSNVSRVLGQKLLQLMYANFSKRGKFSSLLLYRSRLSSNYLNTYNVVCLYWVCEGFISPETISKIKRPIIWRLSDMWPFTGGCHYSGQCTCYTQNCGRCPFLQSRITQDPSRLLWNRKAKSWKGLDLTIVSPSRWLADCASPFTTRPRPPISRGWHRPPSRSGTAAPGSNSDIGSATRSSTRRRCAAAASTTRTCISAAGSCVRTSLRARTPRGSPRARIPNTSRS